MRSCMSCLLFGCIDINLLEILLTCYEIYTWMYYPLQIHILLSSNPTLSAFMLTNVICM